MDTRTMTYAEELAQLIRKPTISTYYEKDKSKYKDFQNLLKEIFPNLYAVVKEETFDQSLLLIWEGKNKNIEPIMFMNHHDVVEASGQWEHEPFSGDIADGKIWGRGTLDTKGGLYCMLKAADELAKEGFVPERDIYFESSCNEEVDATGALTIAQTLSQRGIHFYMILDEGGFIMYDPIGGADGTFAMVGMGEKATIEMKFIAKGDGGHASTPTENTPLVRLGKFMAECDKGDIFPAEISPVIEIMFKRLAPYMKGVTQKILQNPKAFGPIIKKVMPSMSATANAFLRTTIAFTMAKGSDGTNVIPTEAYVVGNMRASHHQGKEKSIEAVTKLAKKYDLEVQFIDPGFESALSDPKAKAFENIENAVKNIFDSVEVVPYTMTGASDCRFFTELCENCYRFVPFHINDEQLASVHGINENLDLSCLVPAVDFYKYLMKNCK